MKPDQDNAATAHSAAARSSVAGPVRVHLIASHRVLRKKKYVIAYIFLMRFRPSSPPEPSERHCRSHSIRARIIWYRKVGVRYASGSGALAERPLAASLLTVLRRSLLLSGTPGQRISVAHLATAGQPSHEDQQQQQQQQKQLQEQQQSQLSSQQSSVVDDEMVLNKRVLRDDVAPRADESALAPPPRRVPNVAGQT